MGKPGVSFLGKVVGNKKCCKGRHKGWRVSALLHPRRSNRWGLSCEAKQTGGLGKRKCFFAGLLLQRSWVMFPARQGMVHIHVSANTRKTWACFQALWLWASCLTLSISVPLAEKLFFQASLASPGLFRLWEVGMGCTPTALLQQAATSGV